MTGIAALKQRRGELADKLLTLARDPAEFGKIEKEIGEVDEELSRTQRALDLSRASAKPIADEAAAQEQAADSARLQVSRAVRATWGASEYLSYARSLIGFKVEPDKHFRTLGEQMGAIARYYASQGTALDSRLVRAPAGSGESDASAGGFLVQSDFMTAVWTRAYDEGQILERVFKLPISANSNGTKIPAVDESSRATGSRWGGVQSYWIAEGDTISATKPKFRLVEFDLKKLGSLMYVTDEMLADSTQLNSIATQAFSEEITFMTEDAIIEGDGVGKPLGILNAPCLVTVAKDSGQAAGTLSLNNVMSMWSRMWARSRKNAVWFINQDVEPQLYQLNQPVGSGGYPMYYPPGGIKDAPYATLLGRPVIPIEYASTLGTPGDIILADFSQYTLADKRGMQAASSMHVRFVTDEMTFRFVYRVDGNPMWHTPLTPFKGSNSKSPFVALAQR